MFEALLTSLGTIAAGSLLHNGQQYRKLIALEGELAARLVIHVPVETFELAAPTITLEQPITLGCLGASQIMAIVAATSLVLALLVVSGVGPQKIRMACQFMMSIARSK